MSTDKNCPFAFDTAPLIQPELVFLKEVLQVRSCLDQPIFNAPDLRSLVALCCTADTLLERQHKVARNFDEVDVGVLKSIENLCMQISSSLSTKDVLQQLKLLHLFPYLNQYLASELQEPSQSNLGAAYLLYISLLNQVVMMGTQLYHDACVPGHHKYAAHQIALLYQSLNMLQGETKPIRRLIEARFDEIKSITESKNPYLSLELSDWVQEITWLCREEVKNCPPYVHRRLDSVLRVLRD